jgi:hypothetical protein
MLGRQSGEEASLFYEFRCDDRVPEPPAQAHRVGHEEGVEFARSIAWMERFICAS